MNIETATVPEEQKWQDLLEEISVSERQVQNLLSGILFERVFPERTVRDGQNSYPLSRYFNEVAVDSGDSVLGLHVFLQSEEHPLSLENLRNRSEMSQQACLLLETDEYIRNEIIRVCRLSILMDHPKRFGIELSGETQTSLQQEKENRLEDLARQLEQQVCRSTGVFGQFILEDVTASATEKLDSLLAVHVQEVYPFRNQISSPLLREQDLKERLHPAGQLALFQEAETEEASETVLSWIRKQDTGPGCSLQRVLQHFQDVPYGWRRLDTRGVVAGLLSSGKLRMFWNGSPLDCSSPDTYNHLRRERDAARVLLSAVSAVSSQDQAEAAAAFESLTEEEIWYEEEQDLTAQIAGWLEEKDGQIQNRLIHEYCSHPYPGRDVYKEADRVIRSLLSVRNRPAVFLPRFTEHTGRLEQLLPEISRGETFFEKNQEDYRAACDLAEKLRPEKEYFPEESGLLPLFAKLEVRIDPSTSFENSLDLQTLCSQLEARYEELLKERRECCITQLKEDISQIEDAARGRNGIVTILHESADFLREKIGYVSSFSTLRQINEAEKQAEEITRKALTRLARLQKKPDHQAVSSAASASTAVSGMEKQKQLELNTVDLFEPVVFSSPEEMEIYLERKKDLLKQVFRKYERIILK